MRSLPKYKLSDINLHGDRRKAEKIYERALSGGEGSIEASKQLEKPRFKSFLKDIIDKRNAGVGRGGALVKDPEPDIIKEELNNDTIAFFAAVEGFLTIEFIKFVL